MKILPLFLVACASPLAWAQTVVVTWNTAALNAIQVTSTPPTVVARAMAVLHTSMYDAWAAYDTTALGSLPTSPARQPASAATAANKATAVSYAAYRALVDLFPTQLAAMNAVMTSLGYDPANTSTDPSTPAGLGNLAAASVLAFRHADGSNQLGDLGGTGPYQDYTGYQPVNFPDALTDPNRWQPVRNPDNTVQKFLSPQWYLVTPFALKFSAQFRPGPQQQAGTWLYDQAMRDIIALGATLTDRAKMSAEYWNDGPGSVTPPGHWNQFAQDISVRDRHSLDDDVKMFFALNSSQLDVSISVWDAKRFYDGIRPISAIRYWYRGAMIQGFAGPGKGITTIDGSNWTPWIPTAPHPEYPSGHSAFSSAAAEILRRFTGSDTYLKKLTFAAGSSTTDRKASPVQDTTLQWLTFSEVADDAGYSRRAGGIHFEEADYRSRTIGRQVAIVVWDRYTQLVNGVQP